MAKKPRRVLERTLAHRNPTEIELDGRLKAERYTVEEIERIGEMASLTSVAIELQDLAALPAALAKLPRLEKLSLGRCRSLKSLAGIEELVHLRELELGDLPIKARELGRLADLPDLATLHLYGKAALPPPSAMHSLIELRLTNTRIDLGKACAVLAKVPSLRTLEIDSWMGLFAVPTAIGKLTQLRTLKLSCNRFLKVPNELRRLTGLEVLAVRRLKEIPEVIFDCAELVELRLDGTFRHVPASIGRLAKLRTLELPWQGKYTVPDELYAMPLQTFEGPREIAKKIGRGAQPTDSDDDLADLASYDFEFGDLGAQLTRLARAPKLRELRLGCPDTSVVPAQIGKLTKLTGLVITGGIREVSPKIGELTELTELRFWSAQLKSLPASIGDLSELLLLDVRSHPSLTIPDTIGKLAKLETLLANTQLPAGIARCAGLVWMMWEVLKPPTKASLTALGKVASLRRLMISQCELVDLDALGRAFANHPIEVLDLGHCMTKGTDLTQLTSLREVSVRDKAAHTLKLCEGKWTTTHPQVGISRMRRRVQKGAIARG